MTGMVANGRLRFMSKAERCMDSIPLRYPKSFDVVISRDRLTCAAPCVLDGELRHPDHLAELPAVPVPGPEGIDCPGGTCGAIG